jgi:hypothetical protein
MAFVPLALAANIVGTAQKAEEHAAHVGKLLIRSVTKLKTKSLTTPQYHVE